MTIILGISVCVIGITTGIGALGSALVGACWGALKKDPEGESGKRTITGAKKGAQVGALVGAGVGVALIAYWGIASGFYILPPY